jgi:hypothetical protein
VRSATPQQVLCGREKWLHGSTWPGGALSPWLQNIVEALNTNALPSPTTNIVADHGWLVSPPKNARPQPTTSIPGSSAAVGASSWNS